MRPNPVLWPLLSVLLTACSTSPNTFDAPGKQIQAEMASAAASANQIPAHGQLPNALYPSLRLDQPVAATKVLEPRFDVAVNDTPVRQVFMGIAADTRYSLLLPNDLEGNISINLKNVTVPEALSAIRQLYGYEYRIEGNRIFIQPRTMQTRIMKVNYLNVIRHGQSDINVISGASGSNSTSGSSSNNGNSNSNTSNQNNQNDQNNSNTQITSKINTTQESNFWPELTLAVKTIVGDKDGRTVVVNPQSGVIIIRAMPQEIAQVEAFLKASQLALEKQVMIEAKIVEVTLNNNFQAGINWAVFGSGTYSVGQVSPGTTISRNGVNISAPISGSAYNSLINASGAAGSMLGMVMHAGNFDMILNLLETQGRVQVLSSPRVATINNQKAVLKVGSDNYYVTGVSATTSSTTVNGTSQSTVIPTVTMQSFFSGIALDVTPQIDDEDFITLHIHPMVSDVKSESQNIDLGNWGTLKLPMASSKVSEIDSVIRAQDGQIVALGGLIRQSSSKTDSQVPVLGGIPLLGNLFKQKADELERRELVVLLRPTVIQAETSWGEDIMQTQKRINNLMGTDNLSLDNYGQTQEKKVVKP